MLSFPDTFRWGCGTSSYQIEGAWQAGGKGLSVWDAFAHTPGRIAHGHTGDVACDHYNRFRDDVALMAGLGLKAYRFSIAWPRVQPDGTGGPNAEGLRFYSDLVDALLEHGIEPWVTLHHWDLPLALQVEHDGWLSPRMPEFFAEFAQICFEHLGDRVRHWITLNEPWVVAMLGHGRGIFAPGRTSLDEPYLAAHQMLRAHAAAADVYHRNFQSEQGGVIGMANNCDWREPASDAPEDVAAAQRALEFYLGWFADPLYTGDYPAVMRERLGSRLPQFSDHDRVLLQGSADFFGLNHYTSQLVAHRDGGDASTEENVNAGITADQDVAFSAHPDWETTDMDWPILPDGCRKLLGWISDRYDAPPIVITENGCATPDPLVDGRVDDAGRIDYLDGYLRAVHAAVSDGADVQGYFLWSFMDNFEWASGFDKRFGIYHVDYETLVRTPKNSALWYRDVIARGGLETEAVRAAADASAD